MSITLDILDRADLLERIHRTESVLDELRQKFQPVETLRTAFVSGDRLRLDGSCEQGGFLRTSLNLARMRHANGDPAEKVRETLQEAVRNFAPVVPAFDYSPFETQFAVHKSQAKKYEGREMPHDMHEVFLVPNRSLGSDYKTVTVKVKRQPAQFEMRDALVSAMIARDFERARTIASDYQLLPAVKGAGPNHLGVLREAILDHTEAALAHLESIPDGYSPDDPPARRELAEGVIRRDPALVRQGLKAVSTRCKTAWSLKTYCTPTKLRRYLSLEKMLPDIRDHLIWHRWLMADWAVAWMALARHTGLKEAFSQPELFCEWVPWELCCDEPSPKDVPPEVGAEPKGLPAKIGKRALKEALFKAVEADQGDEIERLVALGADLEAKDQSKCTPLIAAAALGRLQAAQALVRVGSNMKAIEFQQRTAMSLAAENGHADIVGLLLNAGIPADESDIPATPLIYAAMGDHTETARLLITAGADVNRTAKRNMNRPLTAAIKAGNLALVELLLRSGANVNQPTMSEWLPIRLAAQLGHAEIIKRLIAGGADPNLRYISGESPLHTAAVCGQAGAVSAFLAAGVEVDIRDNYGQTPLHWAASRFQGEATSYPDVLRVLLKGGANVNAQDVGGETPAMRAIGQPDRLLVMIEAGADLSIRTNQGETVFDRAKGCEESLKILRKAS